MCDDTVNKVEHSWVDLFVLWPCFQLVTLKKDGTNRPVNTQLTVNLAGVPPSSLERKDIIYHRSAATPHLFLPVLLSRIWTFCLTTPFSPAIIPMSVIDNWCRVTCKWQPRRRRRLFIGTLHKSPQEAGRGAGAWPPTWGLNGRSLSLPVIHVQTRLAETSLLDCIVLEATLYSCCTSEVLMLPLA